MLHSFDLCCTAVLIVILFYRLDYFLQLPLAFSVSEILTVEGQLAHRSSRKHRNKNWRKKRSRQGRKRGSGLGPAQNRPKGLIHMVEYQPYNGNPRQIASVLLWRPRPIKAHAQSWRTFVQASGNRAGFNDALLDRWFTVYEHLLNPSLKPALYPLLNASPLLPVQLKGRASLLASAVAGAKEETIVLMPALSAARGSVTSGGFAVLVAQIEAVVPHGSSRSTGKFRTAGTMHKHGKTHTAPSGDRSRLAGSRNAAFIPHAMKDCTPGSVLITVLSNAPAGCGGHNVAASELCCYAAAVPPWQ
ncbi:hypothetical protein B0H10DRAFT_1944885 [Mycena sp. CBHHK59/15]|nr:hypothetical protein B0H10DRAFT_1944885 [Mycena sp. CBHHK59/15]